MKPFKKKESEKNRRRKEIRQRKKRETESQHREDESNYQDYQGRGHRNVQKQHSFSPQAQNYPARPHQQADRPKERNEIQEQWEAPRQTPPPQQGFEVNKNHWTPQVQGIPHQEYQHFRNRDKNLKRNELSYPNCLSKQIFEVDFKDIEFENTLNFNEKIVLASYKLKNVGSHELNNLRLNKSRRKGRKIRSKKNKRGNMRLKPNHSSWSNSYTDQNLQTF